MSIETNEVVWKDENGAKTPVNKQKIDELLAKGGSSGGGGGSTVNMNQLKTDSGSPEVTVSGDGGVGITSQKVTAAAGVAISGGGGVATAVGGTAVSGKGAAAASGGVALSGKGAADAGSGFAVSGGNTAKASGGTALSGVGAAQADNGVAVSGVNNATAGAGTAITGKGTATATKGTAITGDGTATAESGTAIAGESTATAKDGVAISGHSAATAENGVAISGYGNPVAVNGTAISGYDDASAKDGTAIAGHGKVTEAALGLSATGMVSAEQGVAIVGRAEGTEEGQYAGSSNAEVLIGGRGITTLPKHAIVIQGVPYIENAAEQTISTTGVVLRLHSATSGATATLSAPTEDNCYMDWNGYTKFTRTSTLEDVTGRLIVENGRFNGAWFAGEVNCLRTQQTSPEINNTDIEEVVITSALAVSPQGVAITGHGVATAEGGIGITATGAATGAFSLSGTGLSTGNIALSAKGTASGNAGVAIAGDGAQARGTTGVVIAGAGATVTVDAGLVLGGQNVRHTVADAWKGLSVTTTTNDGGEVVLQGPKPSGSMALFLGNWKFGAASNLVDKDGLPIVQDGKFAGALDSDLQNHINDKVRHIVADERTKWNKNVTDLEEHKGDSVAHISPDERSSWNKNIQDLDTHKKDTEVHVAADERTKWNQAGVDATQALADAKNANDGLAQSNKEFDTLNEAYTKHATDDVRHITGEERTTWNKAGTDATQALQDAAAASSKAEDVKAELQNEMAERLEAVLHYKGQVVTEGELPAEENTVGDTWNVVDTGANYAWNGTSWDKLSETLDLSPYDQHIGDTNIHIPKVINTDGAISYMANEASGGIMKYTGADGTVGKITLFDGSDTAHTYAQIVAHAADKASIAKLNVTIDGIHYATGTTDVTLPEQELAVKGDITAHAENTELHLQTDERTKWNKAGTDAASALEKLESLEENPDTSGSGLQLHVKDMSKHLGTITGEQGTALIFNEADGGGMRFTRTDNGGSLIAVNDGVSGVYAQMSAHTADKAEITRLNVNPQGIYYTKNAAAPGDNPAERELAVKEDVTAAKTEVTEKVTELTEKVTKLEANPGSDGLNNWDLPGLQAQADFVISPQEVTAPGDTANVAKVNWFSIAAADLPSEEPAFLTAINLLCRTTLQNSATTTPFYMGVWQEKEDGSGGFERVATSLNTQVQKGGEHMVFQFLPVRLAHTTRKPLRFLPVPHRNSTWPDDVTQIEMNLQIYTGNVTPGDTVHVGDTVKDWVPQMTLSIAAGENVKPRSGDGEAPNLGIYALSSDLSAHTKNSDIHVSSAQKADLSWLSGAKSCLTNLQTAYSDGSLKGEKGCTGAQGEKGCTGEPGAKGCKGDPGEGGGEALTDCQKASLEWVGCVRSYSFFTEATEFNNIVDESRIVNEGIKGCWGSVEAMNTTIRSAGLTTCQKEDLAWLHGMVHTLCNYYGVYCTTGQHNFAYVFNGLACNSIFLSCMTNQWVDNGRNFGSSSSSSSSLCAETQTSTRLGKGSQANMQYGGIAIGNKAVVACGHFPSVNNGAIAIGDYACAESDNIAIGYRATVKNALQSIAIGKKASAATGCTSSIAIGYATTADGDGVAIGGRAEALDDSIAIGDIASGVGSQSVALGYNATAKCDYNIAIGSQVCAEGLKSILIGFQTHSNKPSSIGIGQTNITLPYGIIIGTGCIGGGDPSIGSAVAIGFNTQINIMDCYAAVAIGSDTYATDYSVAVGTQAQAKSIYSTALGQYAAGNFCHTVAIGSNAHACAPYAMALGAGAGLHDCRTSLISIGSIDYNTRLAELGIYFIAPDSNLAKTYLDGCAGIGYVTSKGGHGVKKLTELLGTAAFAPTKPST